MSEDNLNCAFDALKTAEKLIDDKSNADLQDTTNLLNLPILNPGDTFYERCSTAKGFRYKDGYSVSYNFLSEYKVSTERQEPYDKDKFHFVLTKYPTGLAWMYWTNKTFTGLTIEECVLKFGIGGWHNSKGVKVKVIFTDDSKTIQNSFLIMICFGGCNIMSKFQEQDKDVFRVWRSAVPDLIQNLIVVGELINLRNGINAPMWWDVPTFNTS
jgi:hypothetical protein